MNAYAIQREIHNSRSTNVLLGTLLAVVSVICLSELKPVIKVAWYIELMRRSEWFQLAEMKGITRLSILCSMNINHPCCILHRIDDKMLRVPELLLLASWGRVKQRHSPCSAHYNVLMWCVKRILHSYIGNKKSGKHGKLCFETITGVSWTISGIITDLKYQSYFFTAFSQTS